MPGLYLHIPFCRKACHYCNFHFSTGLALQEEMVRCIGEEMKMRRQELPDAPLGSIYFGGGTPSLLTQTQLDFLFNQIKKNFNLLPGAEITLEANPDDLNREKLKALSETPINRLSIGVQSFFDEDLIWMNRVHNANNAEKAICDARDIGFEKLTIDLIYGVPGMTDEHWKTNLHKAIELEVDHISAYCLTVEQHTALHQMIAKGKYQQPDEEQAARQFDILVEELSKAGFEQYEISNFARHKRYAVHNTNYWKGEPYLGLGPSAHSFDGQTRSWNIANNAAYIKSISQGELPLEREFLTPQNRFNEGIMTGLRTQWGCNLNGMINSFPEFYKQIEPILQQKIEAGWMEIKDQHLRLTAKGKLMADGLASELFVGEEG